MAGYQDLIDWCNSTALPGNRKTAVSANLYEVHKPGEPAHAAWVGTLSPTPSAPGTFALDGTLQPLGAAKPAQTVHLHVVITNIQDPNNEHASATITGPGIKPEWQSANSLILYNPPDYHGDAVISGKVEIIPEPTPNWTELYPIILGPSYTYHPPTQ
jgi:hypothetical protein